MLTFLSPRGEKHTNLLNLYREQRGGFAAREQKGGFTALIYRLAEKSI